jgi:putative FmdB family regulatory protein
MPIYLYKCPVCSAKRDVVKKIAEIDDPVHCEKCTFAMNRQIVAPMIRPDYAAYNCPITGERIEGRAAHEANLRKHGCRVLDDGEAQAAAAVAKARDEALYDAVGETAARIVANMPYDKQEKLANELDAGVGLGVERSTPSHT